MTYAQVVDVAVPVEMYDAMHAEIIRQSGGAVNGLLVHVGYRTAAGFQVLEVWQSRSHFDRFNDEVVLPILAGLSAAQPGPAPQQHLEELTLHGLVLTGATMVV